jgi:hypothetical protein
MGLNHYNRKNTDFFEIKKLLNILKSSSCVGDAGTKAAAYNSLAAFRRICRRYLTEFSTGTRPSILS